MCLRNILFLRKKHTQICLRRIKNSNSSKFLSNQTPRQMFSLIIQGTHSKMKMILSSLFRGKFFLRRSSFYSTMMIILPLMRWWKWLFGNKKSWMLLRTVWSPLFLRLMRASNRLNLLMICWLKKNRATEMSKNNCKMNKALNKRLLMEFTGLSHHKKG